MPEVTESVEQERQELTVAMKSRKAILGKKAMTNLDSVLKGRVDIVRKKYGEKTAQDLFYNNALSFIK